MNGTPRVVASIRDWRHNVTATVRQNAWRYSVTVRDDDTGNTLPVARVFSDRLAALQYAISIIGAS